MTARFHDLHDVGQVLAEFLRDELGVSDIQVGQPRDVGATIAPAVRLTLLYVTPSPEHRNNAPVTGPTGLMERAPLTLSCFYLATTSGVDGDDPFAAHSVLGQVMTVFHEAGTVRLPLSAAPGVPPGTFTELGAGVLDVTQTTVGLDQLEKIWLALESRPQPWALFDVGLVQLVPRAPARPAAGPVRPGGVRLSGPRAVGRPAVTRLAPDPVRPGGRVRADVVLTGAFEGVLTGGTVLPTGPAVTVGPDGGSLLIDLSAMAGLVALGTGEHALTVRSAGTVSKAWPLRVGAAEAPAVDALAAGAFGQGQDLTLSGAHLAGTSEALAWPDHGIASPGDVRGLAVGDVSDTSVTVRAAALAGLPSGRGPWRLALRVEGGRYTPFVVLDLAS